MENTLEILVQTSHSAIFILSDTEVGKVPIPPNWVWTNQKGEVVNDPFGPSPTVDTQIHSMQYANSVNDLMVKFVRKDTYQGKEMLVMERLYPIPVDSLTKAELAERVLDFEIKMKELHEARFVHGDIRRPRWRAPECFDNIVLTKDGFRLIDTDFSIVMNRDNIEQFVYKKFDEKDELKSFSYYFLNL